MLLYAQSIAACGLALAAWAARTVCGELAAARVAPTINKLPGIAISRTNLIATLRGEPVTGWAYPSTASCRFPGRSVAPGRLPGEGPDEPPHDTHLHEHDLATPAPRSTSRWGCPGGVKNELAAGTGTQQVRSRPRAGLSGPAAI